VKVGSEGMRRSDGGPRVREDKTGFFVGPAPADVS
jgi:hypothetical protein